MKILRLLLASAALFSAALAPAQTGITDLVVARKVNLPGNVSPASLTVDVNDYAPAGMTNATFLRLSSTAPVNISGIAGGTHGRLLWIINVGSFNLTLLDQSALSLAGNRFAIGGPTIVPPGAGVSFWYDGQTQIRWMGLVQGKSTTSWGGITGTLSAQTDLNNALALGSQAALTTGVVDEGDTVLFSAPNATTLRIAALQSGVFAPLLGPGLPFTTAFKSFAQQDYPLASLGLVADGTYIRWIGYNSSGTVVASTTSFVNDDTIIQLGIITLKRVGGVTSFIDDGGPRSFATLPGMAGFSELERTYLRFSSTVTIAPASNNMTLARSAGVILGMSVNWTGLGNKNSLDQASGSGVSFIQLNPATAAGTALPASVTVLTATNYWNGAASVALTNNNNASVKRFLLGVKGGLFAQEGEFQYTNLDAAVAGYATAPFTTLFAQDAFIEIGRVAVVKNASDLSNPTQARFFVTGAGAGGSSGGSPSAVTSVNGTVGEVAVDSPVGAVTISLPAALVFTGKTIAGGTYNSPTLVTAALGTPASGVMTNVSGTALGLTAGNVVTNANLTGDVTSVGNATTLATVTGTTGAFGSASLIPIITVNAKGLVTNVTTVAVGAAAAGSLTGTTLAANVVNASLNSITPTGGTLALTGGMTLTAAAGFISNVGASASSKYIDMANTAGVAQVGILAGGQAFLFASNDNRIYGGGVVIGTFSSTGLAVTGGISLTTNLTYAGAGQLILGDWSSAPLSNRPTWKTSAVNGGTFLQARPDGTGTASALSLFGTSDLTTNTYRLILTGDSASGAIINSLAAGSATIRPLRLQVQGADVASLTAAGLAVTGSISASASVSGYDGAEIRLLGSGASAANAITTAALGSPSILFDHRGSGNTGTFSWRNGTGGSVLLMQLTSTGLAITGALTVINTPASAVITAQFNGTQGIVLWNLDGTSGAKFAEFVKPGALTIGSISRVGTTDAVAYNTTSDVRLKTNVRDFTAAAAGRIIDGLRPRLFDWKSAKDADGKGIIGFIAQEEAAVGAELIRSGAVTPGDPDATTITKQWQRSDSALVPILVAELKALRARMAKLEAK